ncbi:MAG: acyl carrier protein [Halioglobus sp.]|nr:acyl carrier protein [Halioglobus sp.]
MFTLDDFRDAVKQGIKKLTRTEEVVIGDEEDFSDYGLDSLQGISLVLEVETSLGVDLGEFDIEDANTIVLFFNKAKSVVEASR